MTDEEIRALVITMTAELGKSVDEERLAQWVRAFVAKQEPLGDPFQSILDAHRGELYEYGELLEEPK